jgi:hypothetical protein
MQLPRQTFTGTGKMNWEKTGQFVLESEFGGGVGGWVGVGVGKYIFRKITYVLNYVRN